MEQQKVFSWAKAELSKCGVEVDTIVDFTKGDILAKLFGWIAHKRVDKIIANPKINIELVQNLNVALAFAKQELHLKNLNLNAEAFMDPSIVVSTKAAWGVLSLLYKKYGTLFDIAYEFPLLEWAKSLCDDEIPSIKSMGDGKAFLSIIAKLAVDESSDSPMDDDFTPTPSSELSESGEVMPIDLPPSDPVDLALFLTKKNFGIEPPISAGDISSGNSSAILSFLSILHNVATMRLTKTQFEEDNLKKIMLIQSLRADNASLEFENSQKTQEVDVITEKLIVEALDTERLKLMIQVAGLKDSIAELSKQNEEIRAARINREKVLADRALQCKFRLESHVHHLSDYLCMAGDTVALSDIQNNLIAIKQSMSGTEADQIFEIYNLISAESEKIRFLESRLRVQAEEEREHENKKRIERAKRMEEEEQAIARNIHELASPFL